MIAYFVYDSRKDTDTIVLPELGRRMAVSRDLFEQFIAVGPDFSGLPGEACPGLNPQQFGRIVATRDDQSDVCVVEAELWRQRMQHHLG